MNIIQSETLLKLRDLRIGNILIYDGRLVHVTHLSMDVDDEYDEIIGFCHLGTSTNEISGSIRSLTGNLSGMPLTQEILEQCGFVFEKSDQLGGWKLYRNKIAIWVGVGGFHFKHDGCVTVLQSVHDLQNLFSALTGEELPVKF